MTLKEYLDRNDRIREIAKNLGIDIEQYNIELCGIASNFCFVLKEDCYESAKPCMLDKKMVVLTRIQICRYETCVYDCVPFDKWELYLQERKKK